MKKLLYLLLFVPFTFLGQGFLAIEQDSPIEFYEGWNMFGYSCYEPIDVALAFTSIEDKIVIVKDNSGNVYMPEFGFNGIGSLERNRGYQIKLTEAISDFQFCPFLVPLVEGCMDETAFNYNPSANMDDGSCYPIIYGCLDPTAFNFNDYDGDLESNELTGINGVDINTNNGICIPVEEGCTDPNAYNFTQFANTNDGSCGYYGCMDEASCNYNEQATIGDGSCAYAQDGYDCDGNIVPQYQVGDFAEGGIIFQINEDGTGLVSALEDLTEGGTDPYGWGFNGYEWGCYGESVSGADGTSIGTGYQNTMAIVNQGCSTEIGGITAAQAALDAEINGYSDWYLPSRDELLEMYNTIGNGGLEGNIGGFENSDSPYYWSSSEYDNLRAWFVYFNNGSAGKGHEGTNPVKVRVIRAFGEWTMGCMDSLACNFNPEANMADGSCEYADEGYDCDGNITEYVVGMEAEGGIVFYVDETGQHGLVAAMEDLTEGATDPDGLGFNGYEWGCYQEYVDGADGTSIGTGNQNTMDIVNQGCTTEYGGITAAQAALDAEINGYSDWYLPSKDELVEMYNTIGNGGPEGNIGGFETSDRPYYWPSSEGDSYVAWGVNLNSGSALYDYKGFTYRVRVIRSFGYTLGCMDSLACNYNPDANMADGSCEYAEVGYDCEGNITAQIGDIMEGGYLFYLDETAQHGLVAAIEDIGNYEWGCFQEYVNGADGTLIGTGCQNTLDIVAGCSESPIAASEVLAYESVGYSDWYLPSKDELYEMYNSIGPYGSDGNIGGFNDWSAYWSSSEINSHIVWSLEFGNGAPADYPDKNSSYSVRPIRAFGNWTMGCMNETACNYNPEANMADGSCEYPEQYYDCDGNITEYVVGMEAEGGIVFYVDETGQHGLVAAMEDLTEGATDPYGLGFNGYEWGCYQENVYGAYEQNIGVGYKNTMDIINQGCTTEEGGITAAKAALDAEINGYSDWYLPSIDELVEMYNTIGNGSNEGNVGSFETSVWPFFWSSSEYVGDFDGAWGVAFNDAYTTPDDKDGTNRVRAIRAFGNWTIGCMDETACNYNPEANMTDGGCIYAQEGYDCEGNINVQIGDEAFGGMVFYVDETGEHGLVAAMEDLTEGATDPYGWGFNGYEWGCSGENVNGADGTSIGTGYQNTMDIVNQGCDTDNGGITAAQAALNSEINGYNDWYLPSKNELEEMYYTIGHLGPEGNIGGFRSGYYWSSSWISISFNPFTLDSFAKAWGVGFDISGSTQIIIDDFTYSVRPIRSF